MPKEIIRTDNAPTPLAGYSQAVKANIRPTGMRISIAVIAEA